MNLAQLAAKLNLSTAAVSKALNDKPDISEETRQMVKEAAKRYGYSPNIAARQLKRGKTGVVALIMPPDGVNAYHTSYFFYKINAGLHQILSEHGYLPFIYAPSSAEDELKQIERFLSEKVVDCVILTDTHNNDERIKLLQSKGLPFAAMGRTDDETRLNCIDMDYEQMTHDAVSFALKQGHKQLALVTFGDDCAFGRRIKDGFEKALSAHHLTPNDNPVLVVPKHDGMGAEAIAKLMAQPTPPDFVLLVNDDIFYSALSYGRRHQLKLPQMMCLISSSEFFNLINPCDHGFEVPFAELGTALGEAVLSAIKDPKGTKPYQKVVPVPITALPHRTL